MPSSPAHPGAGSFAIPNPQTAKEPVLGRIDAQPSPLSTSVDAWLAALAARGKKPNTIKAYRTFIGSAIRENGWRTPADLTYEAVTAWMAGKREAGVWQGSTYNRNLTALRSLTKFLRRTKRARTDELEDAERAEDDGGPGSRAASTDEARGMIRLAWARGLSDRRRSNEAALERLCCFKAALRSSEPGEWRWKHLQLDAPVPHIAWTKDVQKNRRAQDVALDPELVELLRAHRDARRGAPPVMAGGRRNGNPQLRRVDSNDPEAFVFARRASRTTWREDRARLQIPGEDHRGRPFSPHSARKWFETTLQLAGVPDRLVDWLMRHTGDVGTRYLDPPLDEQRRVLSLLPALWPEQAGGGTGGAVSTQRRSYPQREDSLSSDLTPAGGVPNLSVAHPGLAPTDNPVPVPSLRHTSDEPPPLGGTDRCAAGPAPGLSQGPAAPSFGKHVRDETTRIRSEMPKPGLGLWNSNPRVAAALAGFLDAWARLLKAGAESERQAS
jgi:integrase